MMTAKYWIARYTPDVFRAEPRNVGIWVEAKGRVEAKFYGETEPGLLDGRKLRGFDYPDVYRQWVEYWRSTMSETSPEDLVEASGTHYQVIEGGEVSGTEPDSSRDVVNYLYSVLVSEGGLLEALRVSDEAEDETERLADEVAGAFQEANILGEAGDLLVPHPISRQKRIRGRSKVEYEPAFFQENHQVTLIETVDFTLTKKKNQRDHAGWTAYMYYDVRAERGNIDPFSIVRVRDEDREYQDVLEGLKVLEKESRVINWLDESERSGFVEERRAVAGTG